MAYLSCSKPKGQLPNGDFVFQQYSSDGKVITNTPLTAFGEVSTAPTTPIIQNNFIYSINADVFNTVGTVSNIGGVAEVDGTVSVSEISTRRQIRYMAGQGIIMRYTALFDSGGVQYVGFGNEVDGLFFGYSGIAFGILHRNDSVNNWIPQTTWDDPSDGTGSSGLILDPTKGNVYQIALQWLGFGALKFYIELPNGEFGLVHTIKYSNTSTSVSLTNPNLPFLARAEGGKVYSGSIFAGIQGVENVATGIPNSFGAEVFGVSGSTEILHLRVKGTFNGEINRASIVLTWLSIVGERINTFTTFELLVGGTISGANWIDIGSGASMVESDIAGTTTGEKLLQKIYSGRRSSTIVDLNSQMFEIYANEIITIKASPAFGNVDLGASISWRERV
jgi:hypothetical protein